MLRLVRAASLALLLTVCTPAPAASNDAKHVHGYLQAASENLAPQARDTLQRISDMARRLLAARAYVRAGDSLTRRWSWSAQQIESYRATAEYRELLEAVAAVQARFEVSNPGYSLYANTEARSLDLQLERWNENASVDAVSRELLRAVMRELRAGAYPAQPSASHTQRFVKFLREWQPSAAVALAAPGLSLHGRSRAIDFQVVQGDRVIAGTEITAVRVAWEQEGWKAKLNAAVAGSRFVGPLRSPNEPWHYEYVPAGQRE